MSSSPERSTTETPHHKPYKRATRTKKEEPRAKHLLDGGKERLIEARSRGAQIGSSSQACTRSIGRRRTLERVRRMATVQVCVGSSVRG